MGVGLHLLPPCGELHRGAHAEDGRRVTLPADSRIEQSSGVDADVLGAIWGLETRFGTRLGDIPVISATSTLAWEGRRGRFFEAQLIAALRILQAGDTTTDRMLGSWAGAMGHTQLMPTVFEDYAVDFTGDGRRDIWGTDPADALALRVIAALVIGLGGGWFAGRALVRAFVHGHVPEFLKIPVILTVVLVTYALSNAVLEESGLLTVTMLGLALGNSRIASLGEVKRFKETMTILLVSGVFIILTASLEPAALISALDLRTLAFVLVLLLVVRPLSIWLSTIGAGLTLKERLLVGWIAPRGVVAVAVSGLFAGLLASRGIADGERLVPLAFAVVVATVVAHGFSIAPLARVLGLSSGGDAGLIIVGSGRFTVALAAKLKERDIPVMISDRNWARLRLARQAGIDTHYGEILSEVAEHTISLTSYSHLLAATDNDDYNALICTNFGPEIGRSNVLQIGRDKDETPESRQLMVTLGGRPFLGSAGGIHALDARVAGNWRISATTLSKEYDREAHAADRPADAVTLLVITSGGKLRPDGGARNEALRVGDTIVSLLPPEKAGN